MDLYLRFRIREPTEALTNGYDTDVDAIEKED